ncbi:MAG: MBL fold metallo-hydrolase [Dehalococcoidia bacterium]|nr:MBL fold metallo-hydrolase [Dehalococcoidia bacterium]MDH4291272.1 MBL fold metallo-hydrolase [Dehalococcoidia bacterium]
MIVRFLGTHNAESKNTRLVSFLIDDVLAVDAGSLVSELTFPEQRNIKAILLSHGHYDHIRAVPAFAFNNSDRTTKVIATPKTLEILSSHLIDGVVYPEFTSEASFLRKATLRLVPVELFERQRIEGYEVMAVPVRHNLDGVGFQITSGDGKTLFYTGDTGPGLSSMWGKISPQLIIADLTWPNNLADAAKDAGHLCPEMLREELIEFRRANDYLPKVAVIHMSPQHESEIEREVREVAELLQISIDIAREGEQIVL